jgi:hypothetical protein
LGGGKIPGVFGGMGNSAKALGRAEKRFVGFDFFAVSRVIHVS